MTQRTGADLQAELNTGGSRWKVRPRLIIDLIDSVLTTDAVSSSELGVLDGVTAGTATASKAVVLDASKGIGTITSATITTLTAPTIAGATTYSGAASFSSTVAATGAITPTGGVAAAGGYSVSPRNMHTGANPAAVSTDGTNLDIVTTETYRAEVYVGANTSCTGVAIFNGTAVAGNVQAYLTDSTGTQITGAVTASTAASGTTAFQRIPWSGGAIALKGPATYWVAVQGNNSGGDLRTHVLGNFGADKQTGTTYGTLTVAAAPTTFTTGVGPLASLY